MKSGSLDLHHLDPWQRRVLTWLAVACATVFILLAIEAARQGASDVDHAINSLVQRVREPGLDRTMRRISFLGSGYVLFPLTCVLGAVLSRRHLRLALTAPAVAFGAIVIETLAKFLTGRDRPNTVAYSYPSAHVLGAVVFLGMLVYVLYALARRAHWWRVTGIVSLVAIAAIGYSRLYVNAHWLSDVVGGFTGGLAYVFLVVLLVDHWLARDQPTGTPDMARSLEMEGSEIARSSPSRRASARTADS
jgi:membrane-associated phospholipid phosphatase